MSTQITIESILFSRLSWEYNLHRVVSFSNHFIRLMLCVICYVFCLLSRGSVNSKNVESMCCAINIKRNAFNILTLKRKLHVKEQPVYWLTHSKSLAAFCASTTCNILKHLYEVIKCFVHRSFKVRFFCHPLDLTSWNFDHFQRKSLKKPAVSNNSKLYLHCYNQSVKI